MHHRRRGWLWGCICVALIAGPSLITAGVVLLKLAKRDDRGHRIATVQSAVGRWNDSSNPDGWQALQRLTLFAVLNPGTGPSTGAASGGVAPGACVNMTLQLKPDTQQMDHYTDEVLLFQPTTQMRLRASLPYQLFMLCGMRVSLLQLLPNATAPVPLATLPPVDPAYSYSIDLYQAKGPRQCSKNNDKRYQGSRSRSNSSGAYDCRYNCEVAFGGSYSTDSNFNDKCSLQNAHFDDLAVKVSFHAAIPGANLTSAGYSLDYTQPGAGAGANVLPAGYSRYDQAGGGQRFQLPNIRPGYLPPPVYTAWGANSSLASSPNLSITVRSAADPWLSYMAVTNGSGDFGLSKATLTKTGTMTLALGLLAELVWLLPLCVLGLHLRNTGRSQAGGGGGTTAPAFVLQPGASPYAPPVYGVPACNTTIAATAAVPSERDGLLAAQPYSTDPAVATASYGNPFPPGYPYPPPYGQEDQRPPPPPGLSAGPVGAPPGGGSVEMVQSGYGGAVPPYGGYGYGGYGSYGYVYPASAAAATATTAAGPGEPQAAAPYGAYPQVLYGYPPPPPPAAAQVQQQQQQQQEGVSKA